ncbi:amidase family protein [Streptomyces sp. CNZ287]|uniref:amidase family protein n=1 Tax=Streptomyces sp. B22F1 TaxID=3153566 RepID=UPI00119B14F5
MRTPAPRPSRRSLLALGSAAAAAPALGAGPAHAGTGHGRVPDAPDDFDELDIDGLRRRMADGRLDAVRLTRHYLERIERIDPLLRSVIEVSPDALREARKLDRERRPRGPLHGMPVLLKDMFETADRMHTTAGSYALEGMRVRRDSAVAARLRAAGAVILGKTNLSEWAGGMSLTHHAGWSARGGQTANPYKLDRSPHESSSGTGAAVAANLCVAGIGTEMNGSILDPSSANCVVGVKPTVGLVGRGGMIPGVPSQDSVGPMARTVRDAAILLGTLDLIRGDAYGGGSSTPAALAGYPAVSVPAGFAFGLPVGLTFMGTAWSEPTLLRLAYAYERATAVRRPPEYRAPDVGL